MLAVLGPTRVQDLPGLLYADGTRAVDNPVATSLDFAFLARVPLHSELSSPLLAAYLVACCGRAFLFRASAAASSVN